MTRSKKEAIIILAPGFPKDYGDTACLPERQVFVRMLQQQSPGVHVIVVAFQYPFAGNYYEWFGCTVYPLRGRNRGGIARVLTWLRAWRLLLRLHKNYHILGMMSFWLGECALVGAWFARLFRIRHYAWLLGQDARPGNRYVPLMQPAAASLIALSDFVSDEFHRNYRVRPAHVIAPGIDPAMFDTITSNARPIHIMAAGSLIPLKQYEIFLRVIRGIHGEHPELKVVLCGGGPEDARLCALARRYGLAGVITFTGEVPHQTVLRFMQQSRIFLHTSSYEGFGIVHAEALYAGAQVVSFIPPPGRTVRRWHAVTTESEMIGTAMQLLQQDAAPESILFRHMSETVQQSLDLLLAPRAAISNTVQTLPS
ncbi:MAG TPA: glycosyltransferase family 4 protein [Flavisolibacter sp.]